MANKPPRGSGAGASAGTLWNSAVAHHQAGRLREAEAAYRQILETIPTHADARHLLGVVALQTGRLDEAARLITDALALNPKLAAAHNNLGNVRLGQERLAEAQAAFEQAVRLQPSYGDAHLNLGNLLRGAGRLQEAATHLRKAAAADAKSVQAHVNLGATLLALGDARGAVRALEQAARLKPGDADTLSSLGIALADVDELPRALETLDRALKIDPRSVSALTNRGSVLARMGRHPAARDDLQRALAIDPRSAAAHCNLGTVQRDAGRSDEAVDSFRRALQVDPALAEAQMGLAMALRDLGRVDELRSHTSELQRVHPQSASGFIVQSTLCLDRGDAAGAEEALRQAIAVQPTNADALTRLGHVLMLQGQQDAAIEAYRRAVAVDASHAAARWALVMAEIPAVPLSNAEAAKGRSNFARGLAELDKWFDATRSLQGHKVVGSTQPFYLAYQIADNRELLSRYGALCARLMACAPIDRQPAAASRPSKIRVGVASAHVHDHSVWNALVKGWVQHIDKQGFELILYHLGTRRDAQTEQAAQWVRRIDSGPHDAMRWAQTIATDQLDALIYPEIGMDATTTKLAAMRLAPLQLASWGHPQTSGLASIDHYLSAADLEPPDAEQHYSERLVKLPNLGVCYEPVRVTPVQPDLAPLGVPDDVPLLLCPGQPFKYAPAQDAVWSDISRRAAPCRLVFFQPPDSALGRRFEQRLTRHYTSAGLDIARCVSFIPFLDRARFFGLMQRAQLFLDSIGFSGFNTVMQAIECGLPVVTLEGQFMRGRLGSAIMRRLGLHELVVGSDAAYVDLVVALAQDAARRAELAARIQAARAGLFSDQAPVRALEQFLVEHTRGRTLTPPPT